MAFSSEWKLYGRMPRRIGRLYEARSPTFILYIAYIYIYANLDLRYSAEPPTGTTAVWCGCTGRSVGCRSPFSRRRVVCSDSRCEAYLFEKGNGERGRAFLACGSDQVLFMCTGLFGTSALYSCFFFWFLRACVFPSRGGECCRVSAALRRRCLGSGALEQRGLRRTAASCAGARRRRLVEGQPAPIG